MNNTTGKEKLLDGFKIGNTKLLSRELTNDILVGSFMGLLAYIEDKDILDKLHSWGVIVTSRDTCGRAPGSQMGPGLSEFIEKV